MKLKDLISQSTAHSPESLAELRAEIETHSASETLSKQTMDVLNSLELKYNLLVEQKTALELFLYRFRDAKIVNAVCPFYTSLAIDRHKLYENAVKHGLRVKKHQKFTGICIRYGQGEQSFTAIYFASGAINCVGVKCLDTRGIEYIQDTLKIHAPLLFGTTDAASCVYNTRRISNRVTSLKVPRCISLNRLELFLTSPFWRDCKYVSEIFPGLIYRVKDYKAKVLYFTTGSMICCGITSSHLRDRIGEILATKLAYYIDRTRE